MRQSRWMKLFSEYGFKAKYHLGKENVVVESCPKAKNVSIDVAWLGPNECEKRWRVVHIAIEEAYTIKYSIHPEADAT
ncbi:hypothetical protein Tco_1186247 [Tanacetum coccineum]